ncbi:hypothetical protein GCM10017790_08180 [Amycolatopsis oliviviridis]|uniref:Uncharacterized protein n=1 Tax=Amycolatopsis oliviviridis TaxID=1471590 RepID=A0ABQ3L5R3_9PSEU|nr:hypothetical protein GCM10017790_08180 [Amycolatopsis oliviviridis]
MHCPAGLDPGTAPGQDDRARRTVKTEDHVELCGTPIFDSLVEETRRAAARSGDGDSELTEQHTDAGQGIDDDRTPR